ncbi:M14 family zinc carboxypeptidase [Cetobacterium sp.]|uniref:M14 family zinc carboxypeptidase n=1 Tax=Cetobacterium sp. TaxID=2071632 RepID=UPI003F337E59
MKSMKYFIFIALSLNILAYKPNNYKEPETVKRYFPKAISIIETPSVKAGRTEFTTQKEMLDYLGAIHTTNSSSVVNLYGPTSGGFYIPVLIFSRNKALTFKESRNEKPTVLIIAEQHGDEPMSGDVAIATINRVAKGDLNYLLDKINIVFMPRVNPDGAKRFTRVSGERKDINADHLALNTIEATSVSSVYDLFKPEVFIDLHEYISDKDSYSGVAKDDVVPYYDILTLYPTNENYPVDLRKYTKSMIDIMKDSLKKNGFSSDYYYNPFEKPKDGKPFTIYRATSDLTLARNMYGVKGSLAVLIELRGRGIAFENVERRLNSGLIGVESLLKSTYNDAQKIKVSLENRGLDVEQLNMKKSNLTQEETTLPLIDIKTGDLIQTPALLIKN